MDKSTVQKSETESTMSDASASGASYNNHTSMGNSSSDVSKIEYFQLFESVAEVSTFCFLFSLLPVRPSFTRDIKTC